MTRYTVMLFQAAYPEQISIEKFKKEKGIYIECWLLNEDKERHMLLFDGGAFENEQEVNDMVNSLLSIKIK